MTIFLGALAIMMVGGVMALLFQRQARTALTIGFGSAALGCIAGLFPAIQTLFAGDVLTFRQPWRVPYGELFLQVDALSAFFLLAIFGLAFFAAIYGYEYLQAYQERKRLGAALFFFNLLIAAMAIVVTARNGMLFLVAWEVMSLASYFLVNFEHERPEVRAAGFTYLVATHLGTAFLFAMFVLAAREAGSMSFDQFHQLATLSPGAAGALFVLAIIGFGTKAGFVPFHVWLPEAHPAAPSHVSALMSGVMIKTGIYGILRLLTFLGPPPAWWGIALMVIGALSGIVGIIFALAQRDLKRLLAYSSVENIGVIGLGLGVGLLGQTTGQPLVSVAGYAGALFHVLNHALFKGLLFLGAGSVLHATSTLDMERLGGLLKRMPRTGIAFLIGVVAICALPPLNGFASEWLIYNGMLRGGLLINGSKDLLLVFAAVGLAFIGGLVLAGFTKAFGIVFLGEPRSDHAKHAHEAGWRMRLAMTALAAGCVILGLLPMSAMFLVLPAVRLLASFPEDVLTPLLQPLWYISLGGAGIIVGILFFAWLRRAILRRRAVSKTVTWGCGYALPTARMQYTSSSFAQPVVQFLTTVLRSQEKIERLAGYFPPQSGATFSTAAADFAKHLFYQPVFIKIKNLTHRLRWLQHGRVHLYLLYIFLTLIALLLWKGGVLK